MRKALWMASGVLAAGMVLVWPVTSKQGVDYVVRDVRLPLYLKITDFLSRDAHYRALAREAAAGSRTPEERALALSGWTSAHVRPQPEGLPVIDDHVWHTIVRGYGTSDQVVDVLTTLCSYAGVCAIRYPARTRDGRGRLNVAAVWLDGQWRLLDPYHGIALRDRTGGLASLETLRQDPLLIQEQAVGRSYKGVAYSAYFEELPPVPEQAEIKARWHHPWQRVRIELQQLIERGAHR